MADVTIAGLSEATPVKNTAVIPFSDGSNTYRTAASGIVAAAPGTVIQTIGLNNLTSNNVGDNPIAFNVSSITPRFASSKILISTGTVIHRVVGTSTVYYRIDLQRGAEFLTRMADAALYQSFGDGQREFYCTVYLDSPGTTQPITYASHATRINGTQGVSYAEINRADAGYITLQEIAG
jgi:hypothetical protein